MLARLFKPRRRPTLSHTLAERLAVQPAAIGTLNAMIKGAMVADDDERDRLTMQAGAAWLN